MAESKIDSGTLLTISTNYKNEASEAKKSRMEQNKENFDCYHTRDDWSYKQKGQSKESLPKMAMAVEQNSNFIQQGLVDMGDWFKVYPEEGMLEDAMKVKPNDVYVLTNRFLKKDGFLNKIGESVKLGLIGSVMIAKIHGRYVQKPKFKVKYGMQGLKFKRSLVKIEDKAWELKIDLLRQEDYYPDPTGRGLYEMHETFMDYYEVERLAKDEKLYDLSVVQQLKASSSEDSASKLGDKARETGQDIANSSYRNQIKISEYWGNIVSPEGELLMENVMWTVANDRFVIQEPCENPFWHGESPFVASPIIRVPGSVWGKALMDSPTKLNKALSEMFNLMLDGGMMAVHGIKQIREDWLVDAGEVSEGIEAGSTLRVNSSCPPGMKVVENVVTSTVPPDAMNMYNLLNQEFNTSAITNDLRMGVTPFRESKATAIVESSQSITSMFTGLAKQIETAFMEKVLDKAWKTIAQHMEDLDPEKIKSLLGEKRAASLENLSNEELFAETVQGCKFEVFGISATLNKQKDFTKLQAMLQTVASSPILMEEFTKIYDFGKVLTEIMRSLDINPAKIKADQAVVDPSKAQQADQTAPDAQSQIPQAGAPNASPEMSVEGAIPQADFPASRATPSAMA